MIFAGRNLPARAISDELAHWYEAEGWWTQDTLGDLLARGLAAHPETAFNVHSTVRPWSGTYRDVELVARRLAAGLRARGVRPGDVVAFQLPNWMEAAATFWASAFLGAVTVPIVHFYDRKELAHIIASAGPSAFITTERFGRMEYQPDLCADIAVVGLVDRNTDTELPEFDELLAAEPMTGTLKTDPGNPALIAFTSGTTSDPKGVIHSHQTISCETRQLHGNYVPDRGRNLTAAPVGHFIGMLGAFLVPVLDGATIDLIDQWDPTEVLALMKREAVAVGGGPPYFFTSLLDHPDFTDEHLRHMKTAGLGGSTVPAAFTRRLTDLGITVFRSYGSTEHPSVTGTPFDGPEDKRLLTDGCPRPGVEIRLGEDGEIFTRGPDLCLGYTDEALTTRAFDADGWYRTGDVGVLDADGYLTITDRKSDIIIRGGENISALEVEEVLLAMPAVAEAVVVSAPDSRLGERVAAVLHVRSGHATPTLDEIREHFASRGVARQKWPEELHEAVDFPRTASGKIQKTQVRRSIREMSAARAGPRIATQPG
jgi:acyl-CoA synthetase (AMP-forming)/AMP-acid ligase II